MTRPRSVRWWVLALPLLIAGLLPWPAAAIDCARAGTKTEKIICATPALIEADTALNQLFTTVRDAAGKALGPDLRAGQRAWIAARDRDCADAACVTTQMRARTAVLAALAARVSDANPGLPDLRAVWLTGSWRIAAAEPATLAPASDLPPAGSVLSFRPGEICVNDRCRDFGLEPQALADGPGRDRLVELLHLPPATPFYLAYINGKAAYGLVPTPEGGLLAVTPGCGAGGSPCGYVRQPWQPDTAAAKVLQASAGTKGNP